MARPARWLGLDDRAGEGAGFGLDNLPYGVDADGHVVVAVGDRAVDLSRLRGLDVDAPVWASGSLNGFMALGPAAWSATRAQLQAVLADDDHPQAGAMRSRDDLRLVRPWEVADYVDFYASEHHVVNVGRLFRPGSDPIPETWRHLPMGYHGRAATIVASGAEIPRPWGLIPDPASGIGDAGAQPGRPVLTPTQRLDVEMELGFVIGVGSERGAPVGIDDAREHVFGVVVVNDWSARDIQAYESRPLGPFLGKAFATSVSPWVVPLSALEPWAVDGPLQQPAVAPHLCGREPRAYDVHLELRIGAGVVSRSRACELYWSIDQQLAHLTSGGAALRTGDLCATGTISGPAPRTEGSLLEATLGGTRPVALDDGTTRTWIEDGDVVTIRAWCGPDGRPGSLALGAVTNRVVAGREPGGRA